MLCVRCGADNPAGSKYCSQCQAVLIQSGPSPAVGGLEISETQSYVVPQERFLSRHLNELYELLAELLESGAGEAAVGEKLTLLREAYQDFTERAVPGLFDMLLHDEQVWPGHEFPGQVRYLVNSGVDLFGQGLAGLEQALDPLRPEAVEAAFETLQQGNDNLCLSFVMVEERKAELERIR